MYGKKLNNLFFILEIASAHGGYDDRLKKIFNAAIHSQADFIKLQIFNNKYLSHESSTLFSNLKKIEINFKTWKSLIKRKTKKKIILEPFDEQSYIFCKKFKRKVFLKISSTEQDNDSLIEDALKNFKKVFINISGYNEISINSFLKKFKKYKKKIILMYGYQAYPTKINDLRFSFLKYINYFNIPTGYADHSCFRKIYETYVATERAIGVGARYIEKHISISYKERYPDYHSSFNIVDFNNYVNFFKRNFFSQVKKISVTEKKYCKIMNKFAVLKDNVLKGEPISQKKIIFLRTGKSGLKRSDINDLIKLKYCYNRKLKFNEILSNKFFYKK
jgi:sialic acid synthase SpsE